MKTRHQCRTFSWKPKWSRESTKRQATANAEKRGVALQAGIATQTDAWSRDQRQDRGLDGRELRGLWKLEILAAAPAKDSYLTRYMDRVY